LALWGESRLEVVLPMDGRLIGDERDLYRFPGGGRGNQYYNSPALVLKQYHIRVQTGAPNPSPPTTRRGAGGDWAESGFGG